MTLLIDACLSPEWVTYLDLHDIPAVHWSMVGAADAEDRVIFAHAFENDLVIFTHDLDFGTLLAHAGMHGPSVIQARVDDPMPDFLGPTLRKVLAEFADLLQSGALITILPERTKVRILPI